MSYRTSDKHREFLIDFFRRDVYLITEMRGGAVYRTKKLGEVAATAEPFKPGAKLILASHTDNHT